MICAIALARQGHRLRHRLRVRHARARGAQAEDRRGRDPRRPLRHRPGRRGDPEGRGPGARRQRLPGLHRAARAQRGLRAQRRAGGGVRLPDAAEHAVDRADVRRDGRQQRDHRDHRVAARDQRLPGAAVRVEVRRAGAHRARARPPHHGGRLRPRRPGGDDGDGGGAADHPGLLALRHDHRVRPHPGERAAHAAGDVLADRQPVDVRGHRPLAGHDVHRRRCRCSR